MYSRNKLFINHKYNRMTFSVENENALRKVEELADLQPKVKQIRLEELG